MSSSYNYTGLDTHPSTTKTRDDKEFMSK